MEYVNHAIRHRLEESSLQIRAIQEGMRGIIPLPVLQLMTARQLEELVCGARLIDIAALKKIVRCVGWMEELFMFVCCIALQYLPLQY